MDITIIESTGLIYRGIVNFIIPDHEGMTIAPIVGGDHCTVFHSANPTDLNAFSSFINQVCF